MRGFVLCLAILVLVPFSSTSGQEATGELWVDRAKVKAKGAVKLVCLLPRGAVGKDYSPERDGIEITMGAVTLLSIPPIDDRASLQEKGDRKWKYREKKSETRVGVRRLTLDLEESRLVFKAKKIDVTSVTAGIAEGVPFMVRLGDVVLHDSVNFVATGGGLAYRAVGIPFFKPWDPGEIPSGPPADYRVLYDGCRSGCPETGWPRTNTGKLIEDQTTYEQAWHDTFYCQFGIGEGSPPTPSMPTVDFGSEVVVAIHPPYDHAGLYVGARILSVTESGTGLVVRFEELEVPDGVAPGPWPFCQWALFIAIPDPVGPVTLVRSERKLTEWAPWK